MNTKKNYFAEDSEIYYLKPVNEYNIVEKIKEANEKLFAEETTYDKDIKKSVVSKVRRVTFAEQIEEFRTITVISDSSEDSVQQENEDTNFFVEEKSSKKKFVVTKILDKLEIINEETLNDKEKSDTNLMNTEEDKPTLQEEIVIPIHVNDEHKEEDDHTCTTILNLNIQNCKSDQNEEIDTNEIVHKQEFSSSEPLINEHNRANQNEKVEELFNEIEEAVNDSMLSNNNHIDQINCENILDDKCKLNGNINLENNKEDDNAIVIVKMDQTEIDNNSKDNVEENIDSLDHNNDNLETNTTDDDISLIPAAYIPNDNINLLKKARIRNITTYELHGFKNKSLYQHRSCCDYKCGNLKLPKYTGYMSEYGLSLEQKMEREQKIVEKQKCSLQRKVLATELEMQKMHDNEKAFTKWLKNKMRYPLKKVRNMFDNNITKPSLTVSCHQNDSKNDHNIKQKKEQKISASFIVKNNTKRAQTGSIKSKLNIIKLPKFT